MACTELWRRLAGRGKRHAKAAAGRPLSWEGKEQQEEEGPGHSAVGPSRASQATVKTVAYPVGGEGRLCYLKLKSETLWFGFGDEQRAEAMSRAVTSHLEPVPHPGFLENELLPGRAADKLTEDVGITLFLFLLSPWSHLFARRLCNTLERGGGNSSGQETLSMATWEGGQARAPVFSF